MDQFIYNGKYYKDDEPVIGPSNRGLRFGDGVFESMKCRNGQLEFATEHFERLWKGMQVLRFEIPGHFIPGKLEEMILSLCKKNGNESLSRVRITVFRGDGGIFDAESDHPNYIIQSWKLLQAQTGYNDNGLVLGIFCETQKNIDILANLKHNNYLPNVLAAQFAKEHKLNDAVLLNANGHVCESTVANIFIIKDGKFATPALADGCIAGVMRQQVIGQLTKNNYAVEERSITVDELLNADEVFLTNSISNIRWVQSIGLSSYTHRISWEVYQKIFG